MLLQNRESLIIIPLYKVIIHSLRKNNDDQLSLLKGSDNKWIKKTNERNSYCRR